MDGDIRIFFSYDNWFIFLKLNRKQKISLYWQLVIIFASGDCLPECAPDQLLLKPQSYEKQKNQTL